MKKSITWLAGFSIMAAGLAFADAPKIDSQRINVMLKQYERQMQAQPGAPAPNKAEIQKEITLRLQTADILKAEALKAGLDKQPDTQAAWQNMQAQFYAAQYVDHLAASIEVSDSDLRRQYQQVSQEINLLPIVFPSEQAAEEGLSKLKKGLAYETLLKQVNPEAPQSNWMNPQQLPPEFAQLASQLKNGQISPNVITIDGHYILLKLAGTRQAPDAPAFDQIKEQLRNQAKQEKVSQQINQILKNNGISLNN
ncbi:peptidyl-prolyl cis-trans isomerase [Snodgrassella sp. B3800]|uniref:peptidylprolyl isomerase n=1 Tax=Snodgrassella sp. B3800 TaxID=2818039 RepID=UPI00226AC88D|nr:peptidylprolyl isomerase [Snodgrassella sp. B3800]MCX8746896.1 peptidyl-prolyl cis-trans isomerase [Snodgrassella sp. B3800]